MVYESAKEKLGLTKRKHKDWSDELIMMRNETKFELLNQATRSATSSYMTSACRILQRCYIALKTHWWTEKAAESQTLTTHKDSTKT